MKFRSYGKSTIDTNFNYNNKDAREKAKSLNKPLGLWASPIGKKFYKWEDFCLEEDFNIKSLDEYVDFKLKSDATILRLEKKEDFDRAFKNFGIRDRYLRKKLDWELIEKIYDAVLVLNPRKISFSHISDEYTWDFYTWDVDSLVVFNLEKISVI